MKDGEGAREIQTEAWSEIREDDILKWLKNVDGSLENL
jgi:hypothetical protein